MIQIIGIVGGLCFAYCGVPVAVATLRAGKSVGTPISVAWMILVGSICMYAYLTAQHGFDLILTVNYGVEALSWAIVAFFHYVRFVGRVRR